MDTDAPSSVGNDGGAAPGAAAGTSSSSSSSKPSPRATAIITIGMAGSGKSTFVSRLAADQHQAGKSGPPPYVVNLDPAVGEVGYHANVDVRDTVDYARVMEQYNLGPNGGILTALNLFTTKFDQVLQILEKRAAEVDQILLDTPGQIEIFTWSASGSIITDAMASAMPTVVAYVIDTPRTTAPATFMSNMLYACSIMYKTKLPFILVFNKTDVQPHDFALEWMRDFEAFQAALAAGNATESQAGPTASGAGAGTKGGQEPSYMNSLMNSMSLVLDEFYKNLRAVGVSSMTGEGIDEFLNAVQDARQEYETEYKPELDRLVEEREAKREASKKEQLARLMRDMSVGADSRGDARRASRAAGDDDDEDEEEDGEGEETYEEDGQIVDPDEDEQGPDTDFPGGFGERPDDGTAWPRPG